MFFRLISWWCLVIVLFTVRKLRCEGYVFTGVYLSAGGSSPLHSGIHTPPPCADSPGQTPPGRHPPADNNWADTPLRGHMLGLTLGNGFGTDFQASWQASWHDARIVHSFSPAVYLELFCHCLILYSVQFSLKITGRIGLISFSPPPPSSSNSGKRTFSSRYHIQKQTKRRRNCGNGFFYLKWKIIADREDKLLPNAASGSPD